MTTTTLSGFEGYEELLRRPLEQADPRSFACISNLLEKKPDSPFSFLIKALSSVAVSPRESRAHWKKILEHKRRLELKLCRTVSIRAACVDYYDRLGIDTPLLPQPPPERKAAPPPATAGTTGGHLYGERLREEIMRARRYKHALSVILFEVDLGDAAAGTADKALAVIMKLITRAVRTVDILARHGEGRFLLVLPDTNKREALELAERLKNSIGARMGRLPHFAEGGIRVTIALGQCQQPDTAADFIGRLERLAATAGRSTPADIRVLA